MKIVLIVYFIILVLIALQERPRPTPSSRELSVEKRLIQRLREFAKQLNIPVFVLPAYDLWSWRHGKTVAGMYRHCDRRPVDIRIHERYVHDPSVLAHELGHHLAITGYGDESEAAANREAVLLIRLVTPPEERGMVLPIIEAIQFTSA